MGYGVRVKFVGAKGWLYCTKSIMVWKNEIDTEESSPKLSDFFLSKEDAIELFKLLRMQKNTEDRDFEGIALITFNSRYKPYTEQNVIDFKTW